MNLIKYKEIIHERTEDAPFIGALVVANYCDGTCKDCCNKYLISQPFLLASAKDIMAEIKSNPFNEGVILAGLEWTFQEEDMIELINEAKKNKLPVILYTRMTLGNFTKRYPNITGIYLKHGRYVPELKVDNNYAFGVKLDTSNQGITFI